MILKKQYFIILIAGLLIGAIIFYGFYQVSCLTTQVNELQTSNTNLLSIVHQLQNYVFAEGNIISNNNSNGLLSNSELLQFINTSVNMTGQFFNITLNLYNTGITAATIEVIFINEQALSYFNNNLGIVYSFESAIIQPKETITGNICLPSGSTWNSGMNIELVIQTITGNCYPITISLP